MRKLPKKGDTVAVRIVYRIATIFDTVQIQGFIVPELWWKVKLHWVLKRWQDLAKSTVQLTQTVYFLVAVKRSETETALSQVALTVTVFFNALIHGAQQTDIANSLVSLFSTVYTYIPPPPPPYVGAQQTDTGTGSVKIINTVYFLAVVSGAQRSDTAASRCALTGTVYA